MPAKSLPTSIECSSLSNLNEQLTSIQDALACTESEETWDSIANALSHLSAICQGNADSYPTDLVSALRSSSRPICSALNSERTRLSGTATDSLTTAVIALGAAFEPLIPCYLPTLFNLCTRTNKVCLNRAKACIAACVEHTQAPAIIHQCTLSVTDKSVSLRLASAEVLLACLKCFNPPDLEKEYRAKEIEVCIRATAVDANADVRKVSRKLFEAYKILLPGRVQSFTDPMSPRTRKYLDVKVNVAPRSQPPSRPSSSQSTRSTGSETRTVNAATSSHSSSTNAVTGPQRPSKHVRSMSIQAAPPKRHVPAPILEAVAQAHPPEGARRVREEVRRLKVDMPPPDYIPLRADPGPQRPMSARELPFTTTLFSSDKPTSGPQRVMRVDPSTQPPRTGPIRPAMFNLMPFGTDGAAGEKKERVIGGARRVLRIPEPEITHPTAEEKAATSKATRPRLISTSKSTPAVPPSAVHGPVKEDATRAKKLASSAGASSRTGPGGPGGPSAPSAAKISRSASTAAVTQKTTSSRSKPVEKAPAEKKVEGEKKERLGEDKVRERSRPKGSSKDVGSHAAPTVTMRDRTNRVPSKVTKEVDKGTAKVSRKKARTSPEVEETEAVAPAEVPLPESPKLGPVFEVAPMLAPLASIFEASVQDIPIPALVPAQIQPSTSPAEADPVPSPAEIPLPPQPSSDSPITPPIIISSSVDNPVPRTPSPERRPRRPITEVEQTPISALVASIERGFLSMHRSTPLSPMCEEEESMLNVEESEGDGRVFGIGELLPIHTPAHVKPLFSRNTGVLHA